MIEVYTVYDGSCITKHEARQLGLSKFNGKPCPKGHLLRRSSNGGCAICSAISADKSYKKNQELCVERSKTYNVDRDKKKARAILWRARNPDYFKKHYQENKERITKRNAEFAAKNPEKIKEWARKDRENNKANYRKIIQAYKARKVNACPWWVDHSKIKEICARLPDGCHVDHIVPIGGKTVCGLHVHWNLQHLSASENCRKKNHLPSDDMLIDYSAPGWS